MKIYNIDSNQDSGIYTCIVRSRAGEEARRDIQLTVNSPPVIEPFLFPKNLQEGGRAQVSCQVSSGDMPVYFNWHKDGVPIPMSLQVGFIKLYVGCFFFIFFLNSHKRSPRKKTNSLHSWCSRI